MIFVPYAWEETAKAPDDRVESLRDLLAIENNLAVPGAYHILGGVISPVEGVGPEQLHITGAY